MGWRNEIGDMRETYILDDVGGGSAVYSDGSLQSGARGDAVAGEVGVGDHESVAVPHAGQSEEELRTDRVGYALEWHLSG